MGGLHGLGQPEVGASRDDCAGRLGEPCYLGSRSQRGRISNSIQELAATQYVSPTAFATIYLGLAEKEKCLDWLEKAYEQQDSACWYLKIDQIYDTVRGNPRFEALLTDIFASTR